MVYYVFACFLQTTVRVFVCFCLVVAPYGGKIVGRNWWIIAGCDVNGWLIVSKWAGCKSPCSGM